MNPVFLILNCNSLLCSIPLGMTGELGARIQSTYLTPTWNRSIQECGAVLPPQVSGTIPDTSSDLCTRGRDLPVLSICIKCISSYAWIKTSTYTNLRFICNLTTLNRKCSPSNQPRGKTYWAKDFLVLPCYTKLARSLHLPAAAVVLHKDGPSTPVHDRTHLSDWLSPEALPSSLLESQEWIKETSQDAIKLRTAIYA